MLDSALDCIVAMDHEGRVTEFNHAAVKTFGFAAEEAIGEMLGDLIVPPEMQDAHRNGLARNVAGGEPQILDRRVELTGRRKDGTILPVELTITRIPGTDPPEFMGYLRDITDRIEAVEAQHLLRRRLVSATDAERRRLVRNLHDGTQQRLIAVAMKIQLIRAEMDADPETADREMGEVSDELMAAVDELREMAHGIHPPILTEHGLAAALEVLARRSPIPANVIAEDCDEASELIQATSYFVVSEALTNCAKYSEASTVEVSVVRIEDELTVTITDDGKGGADRTGSGLSGLEDRVEAVGGSLAIVSPSRGGTTVEAVLPCAS